MSKIAVVGGGYSAEREISLSSAINVYEALKESGFDVDLIDLSSEPDEEFIQTLKKYDLVMPILHGIGGEDGTLQKIMDEESINFFGSDAEASKNAFNKETTKQMLKKSGVDVPDGRIVNKETIDEFLNNHSEFVLKPISEGSSIGTLIARGGEYDRSKVDELLENYGQMLAEELISGVEITVPVLGSKALPPVLIIPPKNEEFDLSNKYNGKSKEICPIPEDVVPVSLQHEAMKIAEESHKIIGARHISRTDMIITGSNKVVVLEINTIPGLTKQSLYPKSAAAAGYSFKELVCEFVKLTA